MKNRIKGRTDRRISSAVCCAVETLEERRLLSASIKALIPTLYTGSTTQTPLGDTITQTQFFTSIGVNARYYRIATDDAADGATTSIFTGRSDTVDGGIALFDGEGNLLQIADADATPFTPANERLDAVLQPRTPYIVGVYSLTSIVALDVAFSLPQQAANTPLKLDPSTGTASLDADSGEDTYNAPADPDYFLLDFFNGRNGGSVTVSPIGADVQTTAAVLREVAQAASLASALPGSVAWQTFSMESGPSPMLSVTPPSPLNLADGRYMLSVAPVDFTSPARAYHIDVSALTLAPASIDGEVPLYLGTPLPTSIGQASITRTDILGAGKFYSFTAPSTGPLDLEVAGPTVGTRLSLYDETGVTLLAARGRTTPTGFTYTHNVTAGTTYRVALAPAVGNAGLATLTIRQSYVPQAVNLDPAPLIQPNITLGGTAGARFFRVSLPKDADVLSIRVSRNDANGGNVSARIAGVNIASPISRSASAGNTLNAVLDARTFGREIDVAVAAENVASFNFSMAVVRVARTLPSSTPLASLDLDTGDLSASANVGPVGTAAGVQFWAINTNATSLISITGTADALAVLAQYQEIDGALRLVDFNVPNASGQASRTVTIPPGRMAGVSAVSARPDGGADTVQIGIDGARPSGVGIAVAPEPVPPLQPSDPPYLPPFTTNLRIRKVRLQRLEQRDLWETLIPYNVTSNPLLSIGPANAGGQLALRVQVLDGNNAVLETITTTPGQQIQNQQLSLTPASIAGQKLRFLVEPVGGNLGDGLYTLELSATTNDPRPFQVVEPTFGFGYVQNTPSLPNFEPIQNLTVNSFLESSFTSSTPYNSTVNGSTGSIDVFRFTHGPTPFAVWTEDISASVNTNIKLYKGRYSGGNLVALDQITGTSHSFDFYAADRSSIDARIEMWNTNLARDNFNGTAYEPGRDVWYVVAKNEAGSQGQYRLRAADLAAQQAGPGSTPSYFGYGSLDLDINPSNGVGSTPFTVSSGSLVRVTTPSTVQGNLFVTLTPTTAGTRSYSVDLIDSSGSVFTTIPYSNQTGAIGFNFSVSSLGRYFIRPTLTAGPAVQLSISTAISLRTTSDVLKPGSHQTLTNFNSFTSPSEPYTRANQFADGTFSSTQIITSGSGLKHKVVFWVDQPGFAQFVLTSGGLVTNRVMALYRGHKFDSEGNPYTGGILKDFNSVPQVDGSILLEAQVQPGMYYLTCDASTTGAFQGVTISATVLPAPYSAVVDLDPNSGTTSAENLNRVDALLPIAYPSEAGTLPEYRTTFYKVVTPGGSQAGLLTAGAVYSPPPAGNLNEGRAYMSITRYTPTISHFTNGDPTIDMDGSSDDLGAIVQSTDLALPGNEYYIAVNRDRMFPSRNLHLSAQFTVPQSGTPDIVVDRVRFDPANGRTLVSVDIRNNGYATAGAFQSKLRFSNYPEDSIFTVPGIGPLAAQTFTYLWDPTNRSGFDTASYTADITNLVAERSEGNNFATAALQKFRPSISSITLADPAMDGDSDPNVFGRYVRGVAGTVTGIVITPADQDGLADIYRTYFKEPRSSGSNIYSGPGPHTRANFDFSDLPATSPQTPNRFEAYVQDQWGLTSDVKYASANVVAKSGFFTTFTYDRATHLYTIGYDKDIVKYDKSISQILGASIPLIGDKRQKFILHLGAHGIASLNPATPISLPLGADIELTAFDSELYKKTWTGSTAVTDNFMVGTTLDVSSKYVDVTAAAASFQLRNLNLLSIRTPKIPLFSFGIPKVAAITANFSLGLKAGISAGLKVGLNPQILNDPLNAPLRVGLMSPTFVQPRIEGSAYISGDVEVLGFDLGSLEGRISLGLNVTVGIDNNDPSKVIPFDELADRIRFNVTGDLSFGLSASVIIIGEVWSWEPDPITFPLGGNTVEGIITDDPGLPGPFFQALSRGDIPAGFLQRLGNSQPTVKAGSDLVGAYKLDGTPQLVIDPTTGFAMTVQVADSDPDPGETRGELQFATRGDGVSAWSALAPIPGAADVGNPVLVATNNPAMPYMVVYEAIELPGATAAQSFSDRLAARDLRYRTWDGAAWSGESVLAGGAGGDNAAAAAFAPDGTGVAAWVHNSAAVPMDEQGNYARDAQDIQAALWDPLAQAWGTPEQFMLPADADSQPAVFAENGNAYVTWIHETASGNELWFSTNDGSGWTAAAPLPITGLPAGGLFTSVALGSEAAGRVNTIFNYRVPGADGSLDSKLYNRPATSAGFASPNGIEVIADRTNFSHVRTTNRPDGSLAVSWKAGDGVTNEIFVSTLSADGTAWTKPMRLTQGSTIEERPSVAYEPDGRAQVLYDVVEAGTGDAPAVDAAPMAPGIGGSTAVPLPEIGFVGGLDFNDESSAIAGATSRGNATVINRGVATTDVAIEYLRGDPGAPIVLGTRSVRLKPGATFDAGFDFEIVPGEETYSVRISTADQELVGADDNIVSYTLTGGTDLEVVSFGLLNPNLPPGASNPLQARIRNRSNQAVGAFTVDFRSGDELFPQNPWGSIGGVNVPMLDGGAETVVSIVPSVPFVSGVYEFSVFADSDGMITESTEANNRAATRITRRADPGLTTQGFPPTLVSATLLNSTGTGNVRINAALFNFATGSLGSITAGPVTVRLYRGIDDGDFVEIDSQSFASVAPGGFGTPILFITNGLAGDNRYRVVVVPSSLADDLNQFNNIGEARLLIRGLPDLSPANAAIDNPSIPAGAAAKVTVDISNTGIAAARDVLVEVIGHVVPTDGGVVLGSLRIDVDALTTRSIEIPLNTNIPAGTYDVSVVINRPADVLESTDANNTSAAGTLTVTAMGPGEVSSDYLFDDQPAPGYQIVFTEAVQNLDVSDVELLDLATSTPIPTADLTLALSPDATTATLRYTASFNGALPDGRYRISIAAGAFTDIDGNPNAAISHEFFVFAGDANRDGSVNISDFSVLASRFNQPGVFSQGDFDYSGTVAIGDFAILASKFNTGLPGSAPARLATMAAVFGRMPLAEAIREDVLL